MRCRQHKYTALIKPLFLLPMLLAVMAGVGQNLNNPNKRGPLGTQVNTYSGNLFIPRTDLRIPARMFDLDMTFYYNSILFAEDYGYGKGWSFYYNIRYRQDTTPGAKLFLWGDGREDKYDSVSGGGYKSPTGFFNTLTQYQPGKYLISELDGTKFYFDNPAHKRITSMQEPNGNFINFIYTDTLLTSLTNGAGQTIGFTYNEGGRLAVIRDAISSPERIYTYSYDALGNLKEVKDPLSGKWQYTYLVNGPMKTVADKNNNKIDIIYFPDFTVSELVGCNKRMSFSYDTANKTTVVTDHLDAGNQVTKYTYRVKNDIAWISAMSGNCCGFNMSYEFDEQGNKTKETDANGNVYAYTYDAKGNVLTATDPLNGVSRYAYSEDFNRITNYTDPNGSNYNLQYDAKGNLTQLTAPGSQVYTATYNSTGDITGSTDPKGNVYTYNYDAYGNPTTVTGPNGYNATLAFDARGRLLSLTDARSNTYTTEYDILNRLKKITDPMNDAVQMSYDAAGNMTLLTNKKNENTMFDYDASNRVVASKRPANYRTDMSYDGMNNRLTAKNALGNQMKYTYDNRNRISSVQDPLGNLSTFSYDGNGNVTAVSLPNGQTLTYAYDKLNRLVSISDVAGAVASFGYDKNNNLTGYTNGTGAITSATYNNHNRIQKVTDPLGNSTSFTYDANDNVASITDRNGNTRSYTYDGRNRVKTYTDNNGFVVTVTYDAVGNVTALTDQNNHTTAYTYDYLNRLSTTTYPTAASCNTLTIRRITSQPPSLRMERPLTTSTIR